MTEVEPPVGAPTPGTNDAPPPRPVDEVHHTPGGGIEIGPERPPVIIGSLDFPIHPSGSVGGGRLSLWEKFKQSIGWTGE